MIIESVPIGRMREDGICEIYGYATFLPCDNCGMVRPVKEMLANGDGTFDCTECDSKTYVQRRRERSKAKMAHANAARLAQLRAAKASLVLAKKRTLVLIVLLWASVPMHGATR